MPKPTIDYLRACFAYDPATGVLTRLERPREHFANRRGAWRISLKLYAWDHFMAAM